MTTASQKLVALHCSVWKEKRIVLRYKGGRWEVFESLRPWDIREALKISLEKIEKAVPGAVAKAAKLDDRNFMSKKRRTRRYIAESPDLLYIESPHLREHAEKVAGHYVVTNIPWRDVPHILRLACTAADIEYGSLANISF
jgi:hypothetical protein